LECDGPEALQPELHRLIDVTDDISPHERSEQQIARLNRVLRQRVADLQTILDTVPIGLAIAEDPQGLHIRGNPVNAMYSSAAAHLVRSGKASAGELGDALERIETQVKRAMEMLTRARPDPSSRSGFPTASGGASR
jgi:hypothetical protein